MSEIALLGTRWDHALTDLDLDDLQRRPIADMWSIAEYADHVREVLFAMRFLTDSAIKEPGIDLGAIREPEFTAEPRVIDVRTALDGIEREATALAARLREVAPNTWANMAIVDGISVDLHWVCRHAVHDATHHLGDVDRLRRALVDPPPRRVE